MCPSSRSLFAGTAIAALSLAGVACSSSMPIGKNLDAAVVPDLGAADLVQRRPRSSVYLQVRRRLLHAVLCPAHGSVGESMSIVVSSAILPSPNRIRMFVSDKKDSVNFIPYTQMAALLGTELKTRLGW